jgi:protoporphyrinogen oxidase
MAREHFDFCVVGAGPSGLTLAYKLLTAGKSVLLVERDARIGGLAKSFDYGGHIFDTGPKRFHTDDPVVLEFINEVMRDDLLSIGRSTKVHFLGKYFTWPLGPKDLFGMPPATSIACVLDLLKKRPVTDKESFHQFIRSKYGETLYSLFFAPYTAKFLRWDPEDIHADWASTGINRTVIDKRVKANTLFDLVKSVSLPEKVDTKFLYPKENGFGSFFDKLAGLCAEHSSFKLQLQDRIVGVKESGARLELTTASRSSFSCDQLVWSGNLNDIVKIVGGEQPRLPYLNTIFYNVVCREAGVVAKNRAQWIYVSAGDTLISRVTCMREFADTVSPTGYYNVMCELTDSQAKPVYFKNPESHRDAVIAELVDMSLFTASRFVEAVHVNPVIDTYPIYHRGYHQAFSQGVRSIKKFSKRIHLIGRSGAFWYNNSDHSLRMAIDMSKYFLGKTSQPFDFRGYFGGQAQPNVENVETVAAH